MIPVINARINIWLTPALPNSAFTHWFVTNSVEAVSNMSINMMGKIILAFLITHSMSANTRLTAMKPRYIEVCGSVTPSMADNNRANIERLTVTGAPQATGTLLHETTVAS